MNNNSDTHRIGGIDITEPVKKDKKKPTLFKSEVKIEEEFEDSQHSRFTAYFGSETEDQLNRKTFNALRKST